LCLTHQDVPHADDSDEGSEVLSEDAEEESEEEEPELKAKRPKLASK
jgi:hypothetical protein